MQAAARDVQDFRGRQLTEVLEKKASRREFFLFMHFVFLSQCVLDHQPIVQGNQASATFVCVCAKK